jgi:ABC-type transport system involved in cytochrome bd biosynthesis fused ATPase/permease subunit
LVGKTVYEALVMARSREIKQDVESIFYQFKNLLYPESELALESKIGENGSALSQTEIELVSLVRGFSNNHKFCKFVVVDKFPLLGLDASKLNILTTEFNQTVIFLEYD